MYPDVKSAQSPAEPPKQPSVRDEKSFLALALERFKLCVEAEAERRKDALDDFKFRKGEQWPPEIERQRSADGRPCLTMNRIPQFIRQVTNEQRQQRPAINVNPVGDGGDQDTAEIFQGIIRHIELQSDAEIAYDTGFDHMCTGGFGYWRLVTDYLGDDSFDQEIYIRQIRNPFSVYLDPYATMPDGSDRNYGFIVDDPSPETYKIQYPNSQLASLSEFSSVGDAAPGWVTKEGIRVAEYFYVEQELSKLYLLGDGTATIRKPEDDQQIIKSRDVLTRKVKWAKINAIEVLEEREWAGKWIPIIPVTGDELNIDGKTTYSGIVRNAKDPQRMYNFQCSAATESVALAPKAPWLVVEGQLEGFEKIWEQSNSRNFAVLPYKLVDVGGKPAPPPQRNAVEAPIQAQMLLLRQADNDLKAVTGLYDASLGQHGPDQSGKAILARQKQGDVANLNFSDNLSRSIRLTGKMLLDLIPQIYDTKRLQRIVKPDQTVDQVQIMNSQAQGQQEPSAMVQ